MIYAEMLQRLSPHDGQSMEDARRVLDEQLGVAGWGTPIRQAHEVELRDPSTPWWWKGAEDATQPFMEMARAKGMIT